MSLLNSISDLQPLAIKILADKEWHCFAEVLRGIGNSIMPERAVRFYMGQGSGDRASEKEGGDSRPFDERIRAGRRRGVYLVLSAMLHRKMVECKSDALKPDDREYRLISETPPKRGGSRPRKVCDLGPSPSSRGNAVVSLVEGVQREFASAFPDSKDNGDFRFHCRHLKRIALLQRTMPAPVAPPPETPSITPQAKE